MKRQNAAMKRGSCVFALVLTALVLLGTAPQLTNAKSLYVITEVTNDYRTVPIQAYDIGPDGKLTFQAQYDVPFQFSGLVGLAVDSNSGTLFVTFELGNKIQVLDASTMTELGAVKAPGATNLAGIVYDHEKELLYAVDRRTTNLYCYTWDSEAIKLSQVPGSPFALKEAEAYGLALDETNDRLYVGNLAKEVTVYDTSDWSLVETISLSEMAISVAVDPTRGYLYVGNGYLHQYNLLQYDLNNGTEKKVPIASDAGVIGLGVDVLTGLVYISTGEDSSERANDLMVFDETLEHIQTIPGIGGHPTGLAIPGGHTSYNPLRLTKEIEQAANLDVSDRGFPVVSAGEELTYSIGFDHDQYDLTGVVLLDTLPPEVTFVRADGNNMFGHYDPDRHIYIWEDPPLPAGERVRLNLTVYLKSDTPPGTVFSNRVTINADDFPPTTVGAEAVAAQGKEDVLSISKTVVGEGGTAASHANPGDQITYEICFANNDFANPITQVLVTDMLPQEALFVSATDHGIFGAYDPFSHTYTWAYPGLAPGQSECVELVVQLSKNIPPGQVVENTVVIDSPDAASKSDTAPIVVGYTPLGLSIIAVADNSETGAAPLDFVEAGQEFIYRICFDNLANEYTAHNVTIVDRLPNEVTFLQADGDGTFGEYDPITHTYTWTYPWLSPGATDCVEMRVRLSEAVVSGSVVTNTVMIDSDETPSSSATSELTVGGALLRFSKAVVEGGFEDPDNKGRLIVEPGDYVSYALCFENASDEVLTHLAIVDTLPDEVTYVRADGEGETGYYDTKTHTFTWFYGSLPPKAAACLVLIVQVDEQVGSNVVITNSATIQSKQTPEMTAQAEVVTSGGAGDSVEAQLTVMPALLYRIEAPNPTCLWTLLRLPEGLGKDSITDDPLVLSGAELSEPIIAFRQLHYGTAKRGMVVGYFDKNEFLAATEGYGSFALEVTGTLVGGDSFTGESSVTVLRLGAP